MIRKSSKTFGRTEAAIFLLCLLLGAGASWYAAAPVERSREARIRAGVAGDLLDGLSRGRQGLIGSLAYPPLPTLLTVPLVRLPAPAGGPWAVAWVAIVLGAFLGACVSAWLGRCGLGLTTRVVTAFSLAASPLFLGWMSRGSSNVAFVLVAFAGSCLLMHWLATDQLRSLAYMAVALGVGLAVRHEVVLLLAAAFGLVVLHLVRGRRRRDYVEATLFVFLTPACYVAALWTMANWLIMGDPFFFLRGLGNPAGAAGHWRATWIEGVPWGPALGICAVALIGDLAGRLSRERLRRWLGLAALAPCVIFFWIGRTDALLTRPSAADAELPRVVADFERNFAPAVLVVSGYRGYDVRRLLADGERVTIYHTLSFYPEEMLDKTRGQRAYLLVPEPEGDDRWEDIHLRYPGIFEEPTAFTVYERSWRHWRLWRIVRLDKSDRR